MRSRKAGAARPRSGRAFRGLILTFFLSFLNLAGLLLTVTAFGLREWTNWQFAGLFGMVEGASGIANVYLPNIWRLPVAEMQTSERTPTKLAASAMLIPHWGAAGRFLAGSALLGLAAYHEGLAAVSLTVPVALLLIAAIMLFASSVVARAGVARPDLDVFQVVLRWRNQQRELPPASMTASLLQFGFSILTIPVATLLTPELLYQPQLGLSSSGLAVLAASATGLACLTALVWRSRIDSQAPPEQQHEATRNA